MPIISAAIVNKQGKIILSRQFMDITRIRVEGLLTAFPKLITANKSQCTFVETTAVRYVYQPIEQMLLVLITTKSSNIVEDLATLRLMGRVVPEYDNILTEESIANKAFEILFAFDEIIVGGHRENVTMDQIVTYLEMESHEEQLALEEKKKQEELAKKEARRKAHEIMKKRREGGGYGGIGSGPSMGGSGGGFGGGDEDYSESQDVAPTHHHQHFSETAEEPTPAKPKSKSVGGMSLGKARKQDKSAKVLAESGAQPVAQAAAAPSAPTAEPTENINQAGVHIQIDEKVSAQLNRDGGLNAGTLDVRGDLVVTVSDANYASVRVNLGNTMSDAFNFKTHPNVDKPAFTNDRILTIKGGKPYPVHQSLGIVKWRAANPAGIRLPLSITLWPGDTSASVEFELENPSLLLENVVIQIPLGGAFPDVEECSVGNYTFDPNSGLIQWQISEISSSNSSGTMDIQLNKEVSSDAFFPTHVAFTSQTSAAGVTINDVISTETGMPVKYSSQVQLATDDYVVN